MSNALNTQASNNRLKSWFSICLALVCILATIYPQGVRANGVVAVAGISLPYNSVSIFAGSGTAGASDGAGIAASFYKPSQIATDSGGNLYVADTYNHLIRKITPAGFVSTIAGTGNPSYIDGMGTSASFAYPFGLALDTAGNAYIADTLTQTIRKLSTAGYVSTVAGILSTPGSTDGSDYNALFNNPYATAVDANGNIYVADTANHKIRIITPNNVISTLAGSGSAGSANGKGTAASFNLPKGVAVDANGNVLVADTNNHLIRKISPSGVVTTLAGSGNFAYADGTGSAASFAYPNKLTLDQSGNLYVADTYSNTIRKVTSAGVVTTIADPFTPGPVYGTNSSIYLPEGVAVDQTGIIYVANTPMNQILKVQQNVVELIVSDTFEISATFKPSNATNQNASWSSNNSAVATISPSGVITAVAKGTATITATSADGGFSATIKVLVTNPVTGVTINKSSMSVNSGKTSTLTATVSPSTASNKTVTWKTSDATVASVSQSGVVTGVGNGQATISVITADGAYTASAVVTVKTLVTGIRIENIVSTFASVSTSDLTFDKDGNIYTTDSANHLIRKITPKGIATTFAGSGKVGSTNGTGTGASFNTPLGIAIDSKGNLYVSEFDGQRIRKITPTGVVTTFAGSGTAGSTNGTGTSASFRNPNGLAVDANDNVYVADSVNNIIRKITPSGLVTTFAGNGIDTLKDGTGTNAGFFRPTDITIDSKGNLFVVEVYSQVVRKITPSAVVTTLSVTWDGIEGPFIMPVTIAIDQDDNLYVVNEFSGTIRKITPAGLMTNFAGLHGVTGKVNGIGSTATFNFPHGIAVDSEGNVFVADSSNRLIRKIQQDKFLMTASGTLKFTPIFLPSTASNKSVTWTSSNTAVATVSQSGVVTNVGKGIATITVTTVDGGFTASKSVILPNPVTSVSVNKTSITIAKTKTSQITATVNPSTATNKAVTWTSNKPTVATVSSTGVITGVSAGTATITVKTADGSKTATVAVTVVIPVTSVSVSKSSVTIAKTKTSQITATVNPSTATNKAVTWTSNKPTVATVSSTGVITGVSAGTATITVKTADGSKTATVTVTVSQ
jgi:uncharacterized protein YjdB